MVIFEVAIRIFWSTRIVLYSLFSDLDALRQLDDLGFCLSTLPCPMGLKTPYESQLYSELTSLIG